MIWLGTVQAAEPTEFVFGVVPQQSAKKLAATWGPILNHISDQIGVPVKFSTAKDIPTFEARLAQGEYDLAYMNPYHFVEYAKSPGYRALLKQVDKQIKGIIVAPKNSSLESLADLEGKTLAFPAPAAFAATIIPQATLRNQGVTFTPKYVFSHDSVYMNVARGFLPAGGGVMRTFNAIDDSVRDKLKILWTSPGFTPHAIASHPEVAEIWRTKIADALIELNNDAGKQSLLSAINFKGFMRAKDSDWDDIRALGIIGLVSE